MSKISTNGKALYIARHGETVFNVAGRIQGDHLHTPLTRRGFEQAIALGDAMRTFVGPGDDVELRASDTGRALQTLALITECIGHDWHDARTDPRLREIGMGDWSGVYYRDLGPDISPLADATTGLFRHTAPRGESMRAMASRLGDWIAEQTFERDLIIIMHGMSSRVLRGLLCGLDPLDPYQVPAAQSLPQGSIVRIVDGEEELLHRGSGSGEVA